MTKRNTLLILVLLLAFMLRFWKLDSYPAINADEASIGYDAFSLLQTGYDQHGNFLPFHFQSFNDYKPGLYVYLVLPFVKLFGLNAWSVRIPGAFLGVATVLTLYFLVKELFMGRWSKVDNQWLEKKSHNLVINNQALAIIASCLLAISPWHIHFSRGGWEVNVATFFMTLGVWLFVRAAKSVSGIKYQVLSVVGFVLSLYAYHAARVVVPLLGVGLIVIYRKEVFRNYRSYLIAGVIGVLTLLPLARDLMRNEISSRAVGVGLFADTGPLARINEQRGEHDDYTSIPAKLLHNKPVNYVLAFAENWADYFHGEFLFMTGDPIQRNKVPETGQMYLFDIFFLAIGFAVLFKSKFEFQNSKFTLLWWLVVAPTAAALTFQSPHALRAQNMVIPLTIISALGLTNIFQCLAKLEKSNYKFIGYLFIGIFVIWNFARYQHMYWKHMAREYPFSSQYGMQELTEYLIQEQQKYDKIVVTDRYDQPYILLLYYSKYSPNIFRALHQLSPRDQYGFSTVAHFDKYTFRSIDFDDVRPDYPNSLIVGTPEEIPDEANIVSEIYGTNGYKYFEVVAN
jgi:4-amino-4-deoxy-L-arabinose transferase-like glycosyltransferase